MQAIKANTQEKILSEELMKIVIVGHVDHGKSTVLGRLLADTNSLPEGKLESVRENCKRNSKPFEYAFLLDALKDEQAQGITIDAARCFFHSDKRRYLVFDAPGHIEFLKNMVTGAARAEAALLTIDAEEGIQENTKRHGYLLSMLGVKQVSILINKMDLTGFSEERYNNITREYTDFLKSISVYPLSFIPVAARDGINIVNRSEETAWYKGPTVFEQIENFAHQKSASDEIFRFPVQDIYKFTENNDDRRIVVGTVETGTIAVGDEVSFYPSMKNVKITSIETFNTEKLTMAYAGQAVGFTFHPQVYIKPGELMVKQSEDRPFSKTSFKANIFWMGKAPFIKGKNYKLKLAAQRIGVKLTDVINVIDASELSSVRKKNQVDRHDVAEVILETTKPISFDLISRLENTGRFVIVDNYEISGGGTILAEVEDKTQFEKDIALREKSWDRGLISSAERASIYDHQPKFIVFTGNNEAELGSLAKELERNLFDKGFKAYYLGLSNVKKGLDADFAYRQAEKEEEIRRLGELARILTDSGQIFITTIPELDDHDALRLKLLNEPNEIILISYGQVLLSQIVPDLEIHAASGVGEGLEKALELLKTKQVFLPEYTI